jgi:FkbM family methyltransferase
MGVTLNLWSRYKSFFKLLFFPVIFLRRYYRSIGNKVADRIYDNAKNLFGNRPKLFVEEFEGEFHMDTRSHLFKRLLLNGTYEPELVSIVNKTVNLGDDVIDVGANLGFFSVLFSRKVGLSGRVLSIEPTSKVFDTLSLNLKLNMADNVIAFNGAVGEKKSKITINSIVGKEEYSSVGEVVHHSVKGEKTITEIVECSTIDALVEMHNLKPSFIKIDVEGAEFMVLSGAVNTLKKYHPVILSELSDEMLGACGSSSSDVIGLLKSLGYSLRDPIDGGSEVGGKPYGDLFATYSGTH